MPSPEVTGLTGELNTKGPLVASPNETMVTLNIGRAKLYELINLGELESYLEGHSRKILWGSIRSYIQRRLAAEAQRRGRVA
jgi:hypothetical protein